MYFGLSEEQQSLQDNIKKYLEDNAPLDAIKEVAKGDLDKAQNIHIAHVVIDGMVDGDRVNKALFGLGRLARMTRGTGGLNIDAIAENYWMLYQQTADLWTHELDLRPHQEKF